MKRITGEYPIFAEDAKHGNVENITNRVIDSKIDYGFSKVDQAAYGVGFTNQEQVSFKVLNGAFNQVSEALHYLHKQGVPQYSVGVVYPKDAVVTFNGNIYLSLVDTNEQHVTQVEFWKCLTVDEVKENTDDLPIGTILTVPNNTTKIGYIDYTSGGSYSRLLYPELYTALGTEQFGDFGVTSEIDVFPVGTVLHTLNTNDIPNGWVEWKYAKNSLSNYPTLLNLIQKVATQLPVGDVQNIWLNAIKDKSLPWFDNGFFLRGTQFPATIGDFITDSTYVDTLTALPVVVDTSNTLNPLGVGRDTYDKTTYSPVSSNDTTLTSTDSDKVLIAQKTSNYNGLTAKVSSISLGDNTFETAPKHVNTRLIIKATKFIKHVNSTHKQIIKAFNKGLKDD